MHTPTPSRAGFKRQVVFRIDADDWPLLEAAVSQHGSIQAAVLAGLRALGTSPAKQVGTVEEPPAVVAAEQAREDDVTPAADPGEEITAREAAKLLDLQPSTIRGYIRSGRLAGRYDGEPTWRGWLTTRAAVDAYRAAHPRP